MTHVSESAQSNTRKAYLVGGGIASLAAAAYLIKDGGIAGSNISILEAGPVLGGSLDGAGSPERGYVVRGGRMFTYEAYTCTFDLLSLVPSLLDPAKSVKDEIHEFNDKVISHSRSRLVRNGDRVDTSSLGLDNRDRWDFLCVSAVAQRCRNETLFA
jgi:oleate hydratase